MKPQHALTHCIEFPEFGRKVDRRSIPIEGWFHDPQLASPVAAIEVRVADGLLAATQQLGWRRDVNEVRGFPADVRCGFAMLARWPDHLVEMDAAEFVFSARLGDGTNYEFARHLVRFVDRDYRAMPHGGLLEPHADAVRRRAEIYVSGASSDEPHPAILGLLRRYLPAPPHAVLDVGCGLGGYGRELINLGYSWLGLEVDEADCAELARRGLPHQQVTAGAPLPVEEGLFETALCIEVLEHLDDPGAMAAELARTAPTALVSVPNVELLPYLAPYHVVPWHMLESDHRNFFTRWSLHAVLAAHFRQVEVFSYSPMPVPSAEGLRLDYHLFAVARR